MIQINVLCLLCIFVLNIAEVARIVDGKDSHESIIAQLESRDAAIRAGDPNGF